MRGPRPAGTSGIAARGAGVGGVGCGRPPSTGVTGSEAADAGPSPAAFVAITVKVTGTSFVSPVTTIGLDVPFPIWWVEAMTVYCVIAAPLDDGALKLTVARPSAGTAVTFVGASG